ncbi:MAG: PHP domain-containing protein [Bacteroidales bacterium]|nr:PHP domain-containing protein [Bacteroidales bacterium]
MKWFRADLHIHSVLSPCGDLDMGPVRIIEEAGRKKLDIIALTDHNSALNCEIMSEMGKKAGITVIFGVEVNTREEVHCLTFFENLESLKKFQQFLDSSLPHITNKPEKFGHQLVVNEKEEILEEIDKLLIVSLNRSIEEVEQKVHGLGGIFIPAHADRPVNGIFSQIGFIPETLQIDAIEISSSASLSQMLNQRPEIAKYQVISNSDAHFPQQIGKRVTEYFMESATFDEWQKTLRKEGDRKIRIV